MKYFWLALAILVLVLAACTVSLFYLDQVVRETTELLDQAALAAEAGDYEAARDQVQQCLRVWESHKGGCGTLLRHEEADEVYYALCQLEAYAKAKSREDFLGQLAQARARLEHLRDMEQPAYYNFL